MFIGVRRSVEPGFVWAHQFQVAELVQGSELPRRRLRLPSFGEHRQKHLLGLGAGRWLRPAGCLPPTEGIVRATPLIGEAARAAPGRLGRPLNRLEWLCDPGVDGVHHHLAQNSASQIPRSHESGEICSDHTSQAPAGMQPQRGWLRRSVGMAGGISMA